MTLAAAIKTDPLLFDKLLEPLQQPLAELAQHPLSQAAGKLTVVVFVRLLLFRLFAQTRSARDLLTDVQSSPTARALGFCKLGLSTFHDGFVRYPVVWFARLVQHVQAAFPVAPLDELAALGQIWCGDSSWWPVVRQLGWLASQGLTGVRLHLGLSLNTLCAANFVLSYDTAPGVNERRALLSMVQAGVTYILDRGYVSLPFYRELMERRCGFVIRERNNLKWRVLGALDSAAHPVLAAASCVSDQIVKLPRDPHGTLLRLVCFTCAGHQFRLITNRFDLATHDLESIQPLFAACHGVRASARINRNGQCRDQQLDAEQGLAGGAAVNVQIKSGTNKLHGSAFEYHDNHHLKARPWALTPINGVAQDKPKRVFNQFGGTLGGPIIKDKLFYFASFEGTNDRQLGARFLTLPTAEMRAGDLSAGAVNIYDPATGTPLGLNRVAFANARIPASRISPIALKILKDVPLPNRDGFANNYYATAPYSYDKRTLDAKVNGTYQIDLPPTGASAS